jgi:hypothetical protein
MELKQVRMLGITGAFLGLVLCATLPTRASALEYAFNFTGPGTGPIFSGSGDIFVNSSNVITNITGSIAGSSITELGYHTGSVYTYTATDGRQWLYDNVFKASNVPPFDYYGALFSFGNNIGNIYSIGNQLYLSVDEAGKAFDPGEKISLTVSQTPLPPALPMFLTALGGLWFVLRRRNKNAANSGLALQPFAVT